MSPDEIIERLKEIEPYATKIAEKHEKQTGEFSYARMVGVMEAKIEILIADIKIDSFGRKNV